VISSTGSSGSWRAVRQQFQAVHAGHADVADHHARPVALQLRGQALGFGQRQDFQAGQVQGLAQAWRRCGSSSINTTWMRLSMVMHFGPRTVAG
jgi:hypothetical protein